MRPASHSCEKSPVYRTKSPEFTMMVVPAARATRHKSSTWNFTKRPPMRKIRNPRYAPEFLERKLSPSMAVPAQAVQVGSMVMNDDPTDPDPTDPGDPSTPPTCPGGPADPC
jgi:hypothetical protein